MEVKELFVDCLPEGGVDIDMLMEAMAYDDAGISDITIIAVSLISIAESLSLLQRKIAPREWEMEEPASGK
jgi:hypothetical protein